MLTPKPVQKTSDKALKNPSQSYLRDWIYGGIDGTVTTFAVVSGVVGGELSSIVILILGCSNLLADGFSMAASNYLGTKSEVEQYQHFKTLEAENIETEPSVVKSEIEDIYRNKGLKGKGLTKIVNAIISNKPLLLDIILKEEYGFPLTVRSPLKAAFYTFISFILFGFVPLIPYVFTFSNPFFWSSFLTGFVFFLIGSVKSRWTLNAWLYSGMETLLIGVATASLAFGIGFLLHIYLTVPHV